MEFSRTEGGLLVPQSTIEVSGVWSGQHIRDGKIIDEWEDKNLVVNEGLNAILNIMFRGDTQITTWYIGLFEGNYTPVAGVTAATITAASTECTAYDESVRQTYNEAAASSQSITN
jgi:allantoicase